MNGCLELPGHVQAGSSKVPVKHPLATELEKNDREATSLGSG